MTTKLASASAMPDIANEVKANIAGSIDWVGMDEIEMPVTLATEDGVAPTSAGRITAFVNLTQPDVRGIHMSRLYLHVDHMLSRDSLRPATVRDLLKEFLASHEDLSDQASLRVEFELMARRKALISDNSGWKGYPVSVTASIVDGELVLEMGCEVFYSSTCPCSAALARQLIQERFRQTFSQDKALDYDAVVEFLGSEEGICATPHSQRSRAELLVRIDPELEIFPFLELIDNIEDALSTPVQTAVKREDEQAFAQLNGENLMFCEDAGRRIKLALNANPNYLDFWARASHYESLHPHDAVAVVTKGLPNGYRARLGD